MNVTNFLPVTATTAIKPASLVDLVSHVVSGPVTSPPVVATSLIPSPKSILSHASVSARQFALSAHSMWTVSQKSLSQIAEYLPSPQKILVTGAGLMMPAIAQAGTGDDPIIMSVLHVASVVCPLLGIYGGTKLAEWQMSGPDKNQARAQKKESGESSQQKLSAQEFRVAVAQESAARGAKLYDGILLASQLQETKLQAAILTMDAPHASRMILRLYRESMGSVLPENKRQFLAAGEYYYNLSGRLTIWMSLVLSGQMTPELFAECDLKVRSDFGQSNSKEFKIICQNILGEIFALSQVGVNPYAKRQIPGHLLEQIVSGENLDRVVPDVVLFCLYNLNDYSLPTLLEVCDLLFKHDCSYTFVMLLLEMIALHRKELTEGEKTTVLKFGLQSFSNTLELEGLLYDAEPIESAPQASLSKTIPFKKPESKANPTPPVPEAPKSVTEDNAGADVDINHQVLQFDDPRYKDPKWRNFLKPPGGL